MAYDEDLADRVRDALPSDADVTERKMFGGLAFLLGGHMFAGIVGNEVMVRLGHAAVQQALERDHVREMDLLPVLSRSGPAGARTGFLGPLCRFGRWPFVVRQGGRCPPGQGAFR
jgi:hypothetical protein